MLSQQTKTIKKIILDYKNNIPPSKIVKKYNLSNKTLIYYYLSKFKIPRKKKMRKYSEEEIKRIIREYKNGISLKCISKEFNVTPHAVYAVLKRRKIYKKSPPLFTEKEKEKIIKLYLRGCNTNELAKKYGVSPTSIINLLKKNNVKTRSRLEARELRMKKIKPQRGMTKNKALLLGLLLADGSETKNQITLNTKDKILPELAINLVNKIYGVSGKINKKARKITWFSKALQNDVRKYVSSIVHKPNKKITFSETLLNDEKYYTNFLRGYFSADGAVILNVNKEGRLRREISLDCYNTSLFCLITKLLRKLNIKFSVYNNMQISIHSENELKKFKRKIGFLPLKIQKSKVWKNFRKDILLDIVIKSYSNKFVHKFKNKLDGYRYLKSLYKRMELEKMRKIYKPMLAKPGSIEDLKRKDMIFEPKLDGNY